MTTSPDFQDPALMGEVAELLRREGCTSASIFFDGGELVIDGCAPSFEAKLRLQKLVADIVGHPVRNSMRVYPS